jgi:hypothetical protein
MRRKQAKECFSIVRILKKKWMKKYCIGGVVFFDSTQIPITDIKNKDNSVEVLVYSQLIKQNTIGYYCLDDEKWYLYGEDFYEYQKNNGDNFIWSYFPTTNQ